MCEIPADGGDETMTLVPEKPRDVSDAETLAAASRFSASLRTADTDVVYAIGCAFTTLSNNLIDIEEKVASAPNDARAQLSHTIDMAFAMLEEVLEVLQIRTQRGG
jgi:hypothetical protein